MYTIGFLCIIIQHNFFQLQFFFSRGYALFHFSQFHPDIRQYKELRIFPATGDHGKPFIGQFY